MASSALLLTLALLMLALGGGAAAAAGPPPNFVFVLADDWGWGDVGFNGLRRGSGFDPTSFAAPSHTPSLDRLATRGVILTDFHTASPVCSPSRAGFMTGRDPARFSIHTALNHNWAANQREGQADFLPPTTPTCRSWRRAWTR